MEFVLLLLLVACVAYVALPTLVDFWTGSEPPAEETPEESQLEVPNLGKMTKVQIEEWTRENLGVDLDRRMTKANMIKDIQSRVK